MKVGASVGTATQIEPLYHGLGWESEVKKRTRKQQGLAEYRASVPLETRFKHWVCSKRTYMTWSQHLRRWCEIYRDSNESFKARELALAYYQNEVKPNLTVTHQR